jgi:hypothetical protein
VDDLFSTLGLDPAKACDVLLVGVAYLAALISLHLGYRAGGRTWVRRHGLVWREGKKRKLISGFYPECLIITACAILVLVVDAAIPNVTLWRVMTQYPGYALGALAFVVLVVVVYSFKTVSGARGDPAEKPSDVRRLARAYTAYAPYSIILFCGGALVLIMLALQFGHDQRVFDSEAAHVRALFAEATRLHATHLKALSVDPQQASFAYAQSLATIETAHGRLSLATNLLQDQMNPVFIFATAVFALNILIRFTPAKNAFLDGARSATMVSTAGAIGLCFLFGLITYFHSYAGLLADCIASMSRLAPESRLGAWDMTQRYNELFVSLNERKNLFGLIKAVGGEGSGMATFAFGVQFALERVADREEAKAGRAEIVPFQEWRARAAAGRVSGR